MKDKTIPSVVTNTLTAIGGLSGDPMTTVATAFLAPIAVNVTENFLQRTLTSLQSDRLQLAFQKISYNFKCKNEKGKNIRTDKFMLNNDGEEAKQVLEGILLNIQDEYEKKKVEYHANLFTNLCYDERVLFEQAICVSKIIKEISYRQLCIIAYTYGQKNLKTSGWQARFKNFPILASYGDFYSELFHLEQRGILQQDCPGQAIGGVPLKISELGKIIFNELSLEDLPLEDVSLIGSLIDNINKVISGN